MIAPRVALFIVTQLTGIIWAGANSFELGSPSAHSKFSLKQKLDCCPPGFILRNEDCVCGSAKEDLQIVRCDDTDETRSFIRGGTWVGYVPSTNHPGECPGSNTSFYVGRCPNGYCVNETSNEIALPHNRSAEELDRLICGETRTGILCGQCREGYGPGVNLFLAPCVDCKNDPLSQFGWLLWIVLEFVPLCIMLFVVLYFNIDFLSGPFISYWLYIQIVNASFPVSTTGPIPISTTPLSIFLRLLYIVFYGIFDLQFFTFLFPPFCLSQFGSSWDTLDMMVFKSATTIFPLIVIALIIVYHTCRERGSLSCLCVQSCTKCSCRLKLCKWLTNRISVKSALHGLAAFFILVYSRFLTYCGNLFGRRFIISSDPNADPIEIVRLQGVLYFKDEKHIAYSSITLLFILFIILPPVVLLLLYPSLHQLQQLGINSRFWCLQKIFRLKVFGLFNTPRVQQFADLFQSSYKNHYRFFAGLLLLTRIAIIMVWNLVENRSARFTVLAVLCLCILLLHSLLQPNKKKWINVLDSLMYSHMTAITVLATYFSSSEDDPHPSSLKSLYLTALFVPILYPLLYWSRKVYLKLTRKRCLQMKSGEASVEANVQTGSNTRRSGNSDAVHIYPTKSPFSYSQCTQIGRHDELWLDDN